MSPNFKLIELTDRELFEEYFEKGNTNFKGVYQYTLHSFVNSVPNGFTILNREEDMGIAGIRKSKLSYHPVAMTKKYLVTPKAKPAAP